MRSQVKRNGQGRADPRYSQSKIYSLESGSGHFGLHPTCPGWGRSMACLTCLGCPFLFPPALFPPSPSLPFPSPPMDNLDPLHVLANFISERCKKGAPGCSMLEESSRSEVPEG